VSAATTDLTTNSPQETRDLGQRLGARLTGGEVIALIGPLGAGKTELVKGLAAGNAQTDPALVTSPTFVLVNEYPGPRHLYHLDAYRLNGGAELEALGFDEMVSPDSVAVIEWADRVEDALPEDRLDITIEPTGDTSRKLTLRASGRLSRRLLREFLAHEPPSAGQR
jgi:tRNA threonylcarbamoyladenosine biosynthesis protein TsaE